MSAGRLTPALIERSVQIVDDTGILDLILPPREAGAPGRVGNVRANIRLLLIGILLTTRLGWETTLYSVHKVLTQQLSREAQWDLGVLRPLTSRADAKVRGKVIDLDAPTVIEARKPRKVRWTAGGYEQIGYQDLANAATKIRSLLDYGPGTAAKVPEPERRRRHQAVRQIVDAIITYTTIPRTGTTFAIDATGQWAWTRGPAAEKTKAQKKLDKQRKREKALRQQNLLASSLTLSDEDSTTAEEDDEPALEVAAIHIDDDGNTPAVEPGRPDPTHGVCRDAAWGYKTSKSGDKEVGYGFHSHTIGRVPDPEADPDSEPILIDGFELTPANADVVATSLSLVDRINARLKIETLLGDLLYTNLRADRWAIALAERGIVQGLSMRIDNHKVVDIRGAFMQHGWLFCGAARMENRPLYPGGAASTDNPSEEAWETFHDDVEAFQRVWAFDRKESGLLSPTSKWICPARAGRVGCHALGNDSVQAAIDLGLPVITPPADWQTRDACTRKSIDVTPDPTDPHHQRKLMQRYYYGSRAWRRLTKRRSYIEGIFGILKNPSRQRLRRGQNRLPGLAIATIITALKVGLFNEEQLRAWHARTGAGPTDHPLLKPDPVDWGFRDLTRTEAKALDRARLAALTHDTRSPDSTTPPGDTHPDIAA